MIRFLFPLKWPSLASNFDREIVPILAFVAMESVLAFESSGTQSDYILYYDKAGCLGPRSRLDLKMLQVLE